MNLGSMLLLRRVDKSDKRGEGKPPISKVQNEPPDTTVEAGSIPPFSSNYRDDDAMMFVLLAWCPVDPVDAIVRACPADWAAAPSGSKTKVAKGLFFCNPRGFLPQFIESRS